MKPLYIFDLDGTLALIDHRRPILYAENDPDKWRRFYAACDRDAPNAPVINTMERLRTGGADTWVFSGRSDEVRDKTLVWLTTHTAMTLRELEDGALLMRDAGDHTADDVLKREWYDKMLEVDRARLVGVFDDRDRVVRMWRSVKVTCFQVAEGKF